MIWGGSQAQGEQTKWQTFRNNVDLLMLLLDKLLSDPMVYFALKARKVLK